MFLSPGLQGPFFPERGLFHGLPGFSPDQLQRLEQEGSLIHGFLNRKDGRQDLPLPPYEGSRFLGSLQRICGHQADDVSCITANSSYGQQAGLVIYDRGHRVGTGNIPCRNHCGYTGISHYRRCVQLQQTRMGIR